MDAMGRWMTKLYKHQPPRVVAVPEGLRLQYGEGTMLIPPALDVDKVIRTIPEGRLLTVARLREVLAEMHGADTACPLVTGIHLRIVSEASEERVESGEGDPTPWWRVIDSNGGFRPKFPGGVEEHAARLKAEGHRIEPDRRGRSKRVIDWEKRIAWVEYPCR